MEISELIKESELREKVEFDVLNAGVKNALSKKKLGVVRMRNIIPEKLLATVIQKSNDGEWSYMGLAKCYALFTGVLVSKQAIWKATKQYIFLYLQYVLSALLSDNIDKSLCKSTGLFRRILLEDSTTTKLPNKFKKFFPGSANKNGSNSSFKVQTLYDIVTESFIKFKITPYTDNDLKMSGEILPLVKAKDLIIRDMGYFVIDHFKTIIGKGAFFLSRLKQPITLYDINDKKIDLFKLLKDPKVIDMQILLGSSKLPTRLLAIPLSKKEARKRREKANKNDRVNYSKLYKFLLSWNLMITNIEPEDCDAEQIYQLYSLRWRIESIFKMWKSYMNFKEYNNFASLEQLLITITSKLIFFTIIHQVAIKTFVDEIEKERDREVSFFQLYNLIQEDIQAFVSAIFNPSKRSFYMKLIIKTCLYEKRDDRVNYTKKKKAILSPF